MKQESLFGIPKEEPRARARRHDPLTSHAAAARAETTTAHHQRALCLREVIERPGQTAAEIAQAVGLERHAPSRRLPELRDLECPFVKNGAARKCSVMNSMSMTWWPA